MLDVVYVVLTIVATAATVAAVSFFDHLGR